MGHDDSLQSHHAPSPITNLLQFIEIAPLLSSLFYNLWASWVRYNQGNTKAANNY